MKKTKDDNNNISIIKEETSFLSHGFTSSGWRVQAVCPLCSSSTEVYMRKNSLPLPEEPITCGECGVVFRLLKKNTLKLENYKETKLLKEAKEKLKKEA